MVFLGEEKNCNPSASEGYKIVPPLRKCSPNQAVIKPTLVLVPRLQLLSLKSHMAEEKEEVEEEAQVEQRGVLFFCLAEFWPLQTNKFKTF